MSRSARAGLQVRYGCEGANELLYNIVVSGVPFSCPGVFILLL